MRTCIAVVVMPPSMTRGEPVSSSIWSLGRVGGHVGERGAAAGVGLGGRLVILEVAGLHQLLHAAIGSEGDVQLVGRADLVRLSRRGGDDARVGRAVQRLHAIVVVEGGVELAGGSDRGGVAFLDVLIRLFAAGLRASLARRQGRS